MYVCMFDKIHKNFNYKKDRLSKEEQQLYQRLIGRINRQFTKPSSLISLFKDIFKKFFNFTVGTPENLASYVDFMNDHYDYIIFDESSQIFLEKALPFIALGDKIIIAGDNQQMQPSNWFTNRVATPNEELEDENNLNEIKNLIGKKNFKLDKKTQTYIRRNNEKNGWTNQRFIDVASRFA